MSVSQAELHQYENDPAAVQVAPGVTLTEPQRYHVAIVLDLYQAKGTRGKLVDAFSEDAVYEDLFASCKDRDEVAGQLLNLPMLVQSTETHKAVVKSVTPSTAKTGSREVAADEILVDFEHTFVFKALPKGVTMRTTLVIYSAGDKIVRLQDRPDDQIPDNALLSMFRKLNAVGVPKIVPNAKDEKQDAEEVLKYQR